MALEPFADSPALTFGVELDLQLGSRADFDLTAASPDLLHLLSRKPFPGNVPPEITESMIEINSSVQTGYAAMLAQLQHIRNTLVAAAGPLNIGICGGGTHPFQQWSEQKIFPKPRFQQRSSLYGYLAKQFTIFGQHVHIGCSSGDDAMFLLHSLSRYVPHFIALSASSPFVQGRDTLFDSARLNSVFAFPMSGRAPFCLRWEEFANVYYAKTEATGIIRSMKDFYWDIRPQPEFGTIELRVCGTPLTVERAAALAGYLQSLCRHLLERREAPPVEDDYLVYNYNRFQACRFGLDGAITHPKTYQTVLLRDDIVQTLAAMAPHGEALGSTMALHHLREAAEGASDASYLRQQYASNTPARAIARRWSTARSAGFANKFRQ